MTLYYPTNRPRRVPPRLYPDYKSTVKRSPTKPLIIMPHTLTELTGPVYGQERCSRRRGPDAPAQGRAAGRTHHRARARPRRGRPAGAEHADRDLAGERLRRYIHVVDQHPAPLDPNFTGAGRAKTDKDGYYKFITVKPGAYPWGNPLQRMAPEPHPLLAVRPLVHVAPGDADVLSGRPAVPFDPIFNSVSDEKARTAWSRRSTSRTRCRSGRLPSASTSFCAPQPGPRGRTEHVGNQPSQTVGRSSPTPDAGPEQEVRLEGHVRPPIW